MSLNILREKRESLIVTHKQEVAKRSARFFSFSRWNLQNNPF
jgi:hypothetical protein